MRPVSAPQHAIGIGLDQRPHRANEGVIRLSCRIEAIGTGRLDPDVRTAVDIGAQLPHVGPVRTLRDIRPTHMVDHHRHGDRVQKGSQLREDVRLEIDDDVPPEPGDAMRYDSSRNRSLGDDRAAA